MWPSSNDIITGAVCVNRVLNSKWKSSRVSCTWNACKWIECTSFLVELPPLNPRSFRVLLEKRKFLVETGPERGIVYQILEYRYREQKSQLFPSDPLQPLRNLLETSLSKHCSPIISHRSMLISSRETKRNLRFFEIIYHIYLTKTFAYPLYNISTCIARRSKNSIDFH